MTHEEYNKILAELRIEWKEKPDKRAIILRQVKALQNAMGVNTQLTLVDEAREIYEV